MDDEVTSYFGEMFSEDYPVREETVETLETCVLEDLTQEESAERDRQVSIAEKLFKKKPVRTKTYHNHRKYRGMKSYELREILKEDVFKFCQDNGLIAKSAMCSCGKEMYFHRKVINGTLSPSPIWKCKVRDNSMHTVASFSVRKGTWFERSCLSIQEILWIAYMWLHEYSFISVMHECDHSNETVSQWFKSCTEVCQAILECKNEPLGGAGKIVEVFPCESNDKILGEGQWVFCALEQFSTKSILIIAAEQSNTTVTELLDRYVIPESTILTNLWGFCKNLNKDNFNYLKYEKSITFYDAVTKTEIDDFKTMKTMSSRPPAINKHTKYKYSQKFCETMYRKSLTYSEDAFLTFLKDISKIYTPQVKYVKTLKSIRK